MPLSREGDFRLHHAHTCRIFGRKGQPFGCDCGMFKTRDYMKAQDDLRRRAGELLRQPDNDTHSWQPSYWKKWDEQRDQWLKDAGINQ